MIWISFFSFLFLFWMNLWTFFLSPAGREFFDCHSQINFEGTDLYSFRATTREVRNWFNRCSHPGGYFCWSLQKYFWLLTKVSGSFCNMNLKILAFIKRVWRLPITLLLNEFFLIQYGWSYQNLCIPFPDPHKL